MTHNSYIHESPSHSLQEGYAEMPLQRLVNSSNRIVLRGKWVGTFSPKDSESNVL